MSKKRIIFFILFLLFLALILSGSTDVRKVDFYYQNKMILSCSYQIDIYTTTVIAKNHKGSFEDFGSAVIKGEEENELSKEIEKDVQKIIKDFCKPKIEPRVNYKKGVFSYVDGADGLTVNVDKVIYDVYKALDNGGRVEIQTFVVKPDKTISELKENTKEVSSFSTIYATSSKGRKHNISLAVSKINNYVLASGEQFSFNEIVGKRSEENGYQSSLVIEDGQYTKGVGGGVCQVSTSLYNAVLLAGLYIDEVHAHSLPSSYVNKSFDAMVSDYADLKFCNITDYPIYIRAVADGNKITIVIIGENLYKGYNVKLTSKIIEEVNCNKYDIVKNTIGAECNGKIISYPHSGYVSEGYLELYKNGQTISKRIRRDVYKCQNGKMYGAY